MTGQRPFEPTERARELALHRYITALDSADLETINSVLIQAETDPELDRQIAAVDAAIYAETGLSSPADQARTVRRLLAQHLPSGLPAPEPDAPPPLTVGDVAARLQAEQAQGGPALVSDRETNTRLLGNPTLLPRTITQATVESLMHGLEAGGSARYWEAFRRAALMLGMTRARGQARLAAARRQGSGARSRRGGRKPGGEGQQQDDDHANR